MTVPVEQRITIAETIAEVFPGAELDYDPGYSEEKPRPYSWVKAIINDLWRVQADFDHREYAKTRGSAGIIIYLSVGDIHPSLIGKKLKAEIKGPWPKAHIRQFLLELQSYMLDRIAEALYSFIQLDPDESLVLEVKPEGGPNKIHWALKKPETC